MSEAVEVDPIQHLADVTDALAKRSDLMAEEFRALRRRRFREYLLLIAAVVVLAAVAVLVVIGVNILSSLSQRGRDNHATLQQIQSCTTTTGACYRALAKQGAVNTANSIKIAIDCYNTSPSQASFEQCLAVKLGGAG